jgi:hypothetical protein
MCEIEEPVDDGVGLGRTLEVQNRRNEARARSPVVAARIRSSSRVFRARGQSSPTQPARSI